MNNTRLMLGNLAQDQEGNLLKVVHLNANMKSNIGFEVIDRDQFPLKDGWQAEPIPINEKILKILGWQHYNGKKSGDLTKDTLMKIDVDFIDGKIKIKSHYEGKHLYRDTKIKYVHELQNFVSALNGRNLELTVKEQGDNA